jgi:hypothetical protein
VLVLEPSVDGDVHAVCLDALTDDSDPTSVLSVLYSESVEERTARLRDRADGIARAAFVAVDPVDPSDGADAIRGVGSPTDLTGVGVAITEWIGARGSQENPVVCIEGISTLLQYVAVEHCFRFLHAIRGKCRDHGVGFHAHLTPSAHDPRTVATLKQLFDEQRRVAGASAGDGAVGEAVQAESPVVATEGEPERDRGR